MFSAFALMAQERKRNAVNVTVVRSITNRGMKFLALVTRQSAGLRLNIQGLKNFAECGERCVLTLLYIKTDLIF